MSDGDKAVSGPDLVQGIDASELADGAMLVGHVQGEAVRFASSPRTRVRSNASSGPSSGTSFARSTKSTASPSTSARRRSRSILAA